MSIVGDCDPKLCDVVLKATKKEHRLLLLGMLLIILLNIIEIPHVIIGGVLEYRIMNIDQIKEFAALQSMDAVRSSLLNNLSSCQDEIATNIQSHQNDLLSILTVLDSGNK